MRAVTYDSFASDNSRLKVGDVPAPKVGPGQVLIEVRAAGVNPVDWKVMAGGLDGMMDAVFPVIPGWDVAGVVRGLGPDTPEFAPGDEVMSYARKDVVHAGTFAEYVSVSADDVARKPAAFDWNQAGGLPLAGMTAQRALDRLEIGPDDVLLIHAASGGVGSLAVQIARDRGARVIGTASEKNHDYLRELGAEPVAYGEGLADRVGEMAPGGVSAVADFAGGQLDTTLAVLRPEGRHVSVADNEVEKHGGHWIWVRPDGTGLAELAALADRGALKVEVAETFSLDRVGDAFDASRSGHTRGKLVITP
ncbi:NADP-dependent oxidoreductase [Actinomadura livida]|uniref:NADP-dependent oxidoreductase n=1 Tax=Actinomadura livida TaxID=79909 RepID=A0A7W7III3_9ACTN|nr:MULTISPECIES: NADP-dependent oxidoreductase [Actinomadura]MBB4777722.1 NADPH:quinone reductase-like Zn-dependent oxidoreductase [Actinomadura catellatispora]GGT99169.1 oxidoreductase [Actinomadura livida]